jgi:hypothetical protein
MRKRSISIFVVTIMLLTMLLAVIQFSSEEASAADGVWTTMASMPTARETPGIAVLNNKIYVIGGTGSAGWLTSVEVYDPSTNAWSVLPDTPMAIASAAAVVNNKIYVIGGSYTKTVMEYDPLADTWTPRASMPTERGPYVAVLNLKIYAVGGYNDITGSLNTNEEYDPLLDAWTSKTSMPTARNTAPIAAANGKIYAIGGEYWPNSPFSKVEEYTPTTDTWATKTSMPTARRGPVAAAVNNSIYVVGGSNTVILSTMEMYDSLTDTWTTKPSMPTARYAPAVAVVNGKIYVIGGEQSGGLILNTVEMYDPNPTPTTGLTLPSEPRDPHSTPGDEQVSLSWNAPAFNGGSPITSYKIYRGTTSGSENFFTTLGNVLIFTDTKVTNGLTYYYQISAINDVGEGNKSIEVNATPLVHVNLAERPNILMKLGSMVFSPKTGTAGQEMTISVNITNDGKANATDIQTKFYIRNADGTDTEIGTATTAFLKMGKTTTVSIFWTPEKSGEYSIWANSTCAEEHSSQWWDNKIDDFSIQRVTVNEAPLDDSSPIPGFDMIVIFIATMIGVGILTVMRRRKAQ